MSDHDAAPDPIDKAYVQAETMLDEEAARAARRARVLGAVEGEAGAAPAVSAPRRRYAFGAAGGWLVAASVAGISALVALQFTSPPVRQRPPSPTQAPVAAESAPSPAAQAPAPGPAPAAPPASAPAADAAPPPPPPAAVRARVTPPADIAVPAPLAFPAPPSQAAAAPVAAPPPPSVAHRAEDSVEALIVTGQTAPQTAARAEAPIAQAAPISPEARAARLRAAAAAGRVSELTTLLAQGTPVDAPDSEGETALMKAIQARNPEAAALLRRHGASLDRTNRAGVSARAMVAAVDDPDLNRALGLEP